MRLDVGDTKGDVLANLPDSQTANVSALDKGAQVTVDCEHFIFMFNDAVGHGCVIAR
jgi:hypothetical protein